MSRSSACLAAAGAALPVVASWLPCQRGWQVFRVALTVMAVGAMALAVAALRGAGTRPRRMLGLVGLTSATVVAARIAVSLLDRETVQIDFVDVPETVSIYFAPAIGAWLALGGACLILAAASLPVPVRERSARTLSGD